jgi:Xaa-Pro aminopeptidase
MVRQMTWVEDIRPWEDGNENNWQQVLTSALGAAANLRIGTEHLKLPSLVLAFLGDAYSGANLVDISSSLGAMRVIKVEDEIAIMRQAGQIAIAMVEGGKTALGEGVPEYEIALAVINAGTRKAAGFLTDSGFDAFISPTVHNLQILQSGTHTSLVHRRSSVRVLERGDPVYMCFCGMVNFKQYKLGFDREFFIGEVSDAQARVYEATIAAQRAALAEIRPGAIAEDVHLASCDSYRSNGFDVGYRTGRAIGMSNLEAPELKFGDRTILRAGMTFAVDGGITVPGEFGARVGDSILVTDDGYEVLTPYPGNLCVV